jgi:hypothetical protein
LKKPITPAQDLSIPTVGRQMSRVELPGKAIEEIAPCLGRSMKDRHVLPTEGNDPSPRAPFACHRPDPVLALLDHAPEFARRLPAPQLARYRRTGTLPARQLHRPGPAKGTAYHENREPLEEIGLPLSVGTRQDVEARRRRYGQGVKIPKI